MKKTAVILFAAAALAGCKGKNGAGDVQQDNRVLTKTETAESATVQLTEEFTSEIEPFRENDITPAASGVHIDRILVEVGDPVREGQLIVTLDPTQYTQQLVQLKTVEDENNRLLPDYEAGGISAHYNRLLPVYEAGGISAQQIQQAKAQLDVQREVVANLKKNIEVRSPITGVVTARNYESGDLFSAQPILHIMQIDPLKVIANISEQYFPNVKVGMPVELKVDIFPDQTFTGTVSLIYPALDPTTRTFKVEVKVPNARRTLRPGMYARTIFNMGQKEGVMVPDVAVQKQVGTAERFVYVIEGDSVARRRRVDERRHIVDRVDILSGVGEDKDVADTGRQVGDRVDILSGVGADEAVAVTALSKLYDGAKVEIKQE